jgi:hypothetical protein
MPIHVPKLDRNILQPCVHHLAPALAATVRDRIDSPAGGGFCCDGCGVKVEAN